MKLLLHTDGGSRGNPGPAAYGYVVYSDAGIILEKCGNYIGITTNNQAEYAGLISGIKWVIANYPTCQLTIHMDSLLIVNQVKGEYRVKNADLLPRYQEVRGLLSQLNNWTISYVPRAQNSEADDQVNLALDNNQ